MDLILLNDGLYSLVSVTKEMMAGVELLADADCFDLCDINTITSDHVSRTMERACNGGQEWNSFWLYL